MMLVLLISADTDHQERREPGALRPLLKFIFDRKGISD